MINKKQIELYISGLDDEKTMIQTEDAIVEDDMLLEQFIELSESEMKNAPYGFADSVMLKVKAHTENRVNRIAPLLSKRKLYAAVCFGGAFTIMISTVLGFNNQIFKFILNSSDKINQFLSILSQS